MPFSYLPRTLHSSLKCLCIFPKAAISHHGEYGHHGEYSATVTMVNVTRPGGALIVFKVPESEVFQRVAAYTKMVHDKQEGDNILSLRRPGSAKPAWSLEQSTDKAVGKAIRGMPPPNPELDVWLMVPNFPTAKIDELFDHLLQKFSEWLKDKGVALNEPLRPYAPVSKGRRALTKDRCMVRLPSAAAVRMLIDTWHQQFVPVKGSGMKFRISLENRKYQRVLPAVEDLPDCPVLTANCSEASAEGQQYHNVSAAQDVPPPFPLTPRAKTKEEVAEEELLDLDDDSADDGNDDTMAVDENEMTNATQNSKVKPEGGAP